MSDTFYLVYSIVIGALGASIIAIYGYVILRKQRHKRKGHHKHAHFKFLGAEIKGQNKIVVFGIGAVLVLMPLQMALNPPKVHHPISIVPLKTRTL